MVLKKKKIHEKCKAESLLGLSLSKMGLDALEPSEPSGPDSIGTVYTFGFVPSWAATSEAQYLNCPPSDKGRDDNDCCLIFLALDKNNHLFHKKKPEIYFGEDDACTPADSYSPRNEMEALNTIISLVDFSLSSCKPIQFNVLRKLRKSVIGMIHEYGGAYSMKVKTLGDNSCVKENCLLQWGESNGARTSVQIAYVEGAGRGTIAKEDLDVGDTV